MEKKILINPGNSNTLSSALPIRTYLSDKINNNYKVSNGDDNLRYKSSTNIDKCSGPINLKRFDSYHTVIAQIENKSSKNIYVRVGKIPNEDFAVKINVNNSLEIFGSNGKHPSRPINNSLSSQNIRRTPNKSTYKSIYYINTTTSYGKNNNPKYHSVNKDYSNNTYNYKNKLNEVTKRIDFNTPNGNTLDYNKSRNNYNNNRPQVLTKKDNYPMSNSTYGQNTFSRPIHHYKRSKIIKSIIFQHALGKGMTNLEKELRNPKYYGSGIQKYYKTPKKKNPPKVEIVQKFRSDFKNPNNGTKCLFNKYDPNKNKHNKSYSQFYNRK